MFLSQIKSHCCTTILSVVIMLFMLLSIYRYTLDTDVLSPEQRLFYEQNGFILIKDLVSEEDIDSFRWWLGSMTATNAKSFTQHFISWRQQPQKTEFCCIFYMTHLFSSGGSLSDCAERKWRFQVYWWWEMWRSWSPSLLQIRKRCPKSRTSRKTLDCSVTALYHR